MKFKKSKIEDIIMNEIVDDMMDGMSEEEALEIKNLCENLEETMENTPSGKLAAMTGAMGIVHGAKLVVDTEIKIGLCVAAGLVIHKVVRKVF